MKRSFARWALLITLVVGFTTGAFAQQFEVHPYAGGQFLSDFKAKNNQIGEFDFKNPGIFGIKGGAFVSDSFLVEGNVGFINQMRVRHDFNPPIWGLQYEALGSLNLFRTRFAGVFPYVSAGVGALTLHTHNELDLNGGDTSVYPVRVTAVEVAPGFFRETEQLQIDNGDTFFNFSYGGGVKAQRLWGPLGLRADIRGRTMPNFYNSQMVHAFEMSGGLLFSWGER